MLYTLYANLKSDYSNIFNLVQKRSKITKIPKWDCKKDCYCYCGLNSPLHSIIDEWRGADGAVHKVKENNQIPKLVDIDNIVILFGGCNLLRNKKFIINNKQIHMGVLGFILPTLKSSHYEIEKMFFTDNEIFYEIKKDIESTDIRSLLNNTAFSSILAFSSDSLFIKMLKRRGPNYEEKIDALIDSQPFISSKWWSSAPLRHFLSIST